MQTILVVDRYQNLVNVRLQYHASHDDLVQHVVDLEHDSKEDSGEDTQLRYCPIISAIYPIADERLQPPTDKLGIGEFRQKKRAQDSAQGSDFGVI